MPKEDFTRSPDIPEARRRDFPDLGPVFSHSEPRGPRRCFRDPKYRLQESGVRGPSHLSPIPPPQEAENASAYDADVARLVERLVAERLADLDAISSRARARPPPLRVTLFSF